MKRFLLLVLLLALPAAAQTTVSGYAAIANLKDLGYRGTVGPEDASWLVGFTAEKQGRWFRFGIGGDYSPAQKDAVKTTWSITGRADLAFRPTTWLFFGGGYGVSHTNTDTWAKTGRHPSVFVGLDLPAPWNFGELRATARYTFEGNDPNNLRGESVNVQHLIGSWESPWHPIAAVKYGRWRFTSGGELYKGRTWEMTFGIARRWP